MDKSRIEKHVKPLIGKKSVANLTLLDLEEMQAQIATGRTALIGFVNPYVWDAQVGEHRTSS